MQKLNIPNKLIRLAKMTLDESDAIVIVYDSTTNPFTIGNGVRQGDALSTTLFFNIVLDGAIKELRNAENITKSTQIIAYADDIALVARSEREVSRTRKSSKRQRTGNK